MPSGGGEAAYFFYTFLERVAGAGDEVPRDNS